MVLEIDKILQDIKRYIHTWPNLSVELTVNYLSMYTYYLYIAIYIRYMYIFTYIIHIARIYCRWKIKIYDNIELEE